MLKFPDQIKINILEGFTHEPLKIKNIIIMIRLFAMKKNDYFLGPFFSDDNGAVLITRNMLDILAEAELQTGIMDYGNVNQCSSLVEIRIMSAEELKNLIKGRKLWGIIGREIELFKSKEELLQRIKHNNNHLILPQTLRVNWDDVTPSEVSLELLTNKSHIAR